jgi:hypothetical protein
MKADRSDRLLCHVSRQIDAVDEDEFLMEFDSDDDEGRETEAKRKRRISRYFVDKEVPERKFQHSLFKFFLFQNCHSMIFRLQVLL